MKGYYKCCCGEEYISDFPYDKVRCLECSSFIKRKKYINEKEEETIKAIW